jgi:DNA-binding response OmpR family regulator
MAVKALVVDDDPEILALLQDLVSEMGAQVTTAVDGATALDLFRQEHHDLVVTDLLIPKLDGIQLANTIKSESEGKAKVVIVTAITHSLSDDLKHSQADDSFGKPIPIRRFRKRLKQLVPQLDG